VVDIGHCVFTGRISKSQCSSLITDNCVNVVLLTI